MIYYESLANAKRERFSIYILFVPKIIVILFPMLTISVYFSYPFNEEVLNPFLQ